MWRKQDILLPGYSRRKWSSINLSANLLSILNRSSSSNPMVSSSHMHCLVQAYHHFWKKKNAFLYVGRNPLQKNMFSEVFRKILRSMFFMSSLMTRAWIWVSDFLSADRHQYITIISHSRSLWIILHTAWKLKRLSS